MTDEPLFAGYEPPPAPDSTLSPDRRRTLQQAANIAAGLHPLTHGPLHPLASRHRDAGAPKGDAFTCGSCVHRRAIKWHAASYPKCWLPNPFVGADAPSSAIYWRVSHSATSDVRAWWPACRDYSPGDSLSSDAARYIPEDSP